MINKPWVVFLNTNGAFLLVFFVGLGLLLWHGGRREFVRLVFSVALVTATVFVLKELYNYPRPFLVNDMGKEAGLAYFPSFPSFHSALAFTAATNVTMHRRRLGIVLVLLAVLVGLGRVLANVHYPIDIYVGVIVGVSVAVFIENAIS